MFLKTYYLRNLHVGLICVQKHLKWMIIADNRFMKFQKEWKIVGKLFFVRSGYVKYFLKMSQTSKNVLSKSELNVLYGVWFYQNSVLNIIKRKQLLLIIQGLSTRLKTLLTQSLLKMQNWLIFNSDRNRENVFTPKLFDELFFVLGERWKVFY